MHRGVRDCVLPIALLVAACGAPAPAAAPVPLGPAVAAAPVIAVRDSLRTGARAGADTGDHRPHYERPRGARADSMMRERLARETAERDAAQDSLRDGAAWRTELERPITFLEGGRQLTPEAREVLARKGAILASHPAARLRIAGGTDDGGRVPADTLLGMRRARAAKDFLVGLGVAAERLESGLARCDEVVESNQASFVLLAAWRPATCE